jgi:ubiquinone/menaquinone biosynthesis C-methylase UbiE
MLATAPNTVNYWPESACAKAFWGQQELPPYRRLLTDTAAWLDPKPAERWLDLGCGCGQLTQALWEKSRGSLEEVVGLDCAAVNERAFEKLCATVSPPPDGHVRFAVCDFSHGLPAWDDGQFDGVVSGLAIQYAECYSHEQGRWTTDAYVHLLSEIYRVLRNGGRFVFSVNVPEPAWSRVALHALPGIFRARRPARYLRDSWRMFRYGAWLSREARRGRFHYLPIQQLRAMLAGAGFEHIEYRLTYARQAYLIRCRKPGF